MGEVSSLHELFRELHIEEKVSPKNPLYQKHSLEAEKILLQLMESLSDDQCKLLNDYNNARANESAFYFEELFAVGFQYGAQITMDALANDQS